MLAKTYDLRFEERVILISAEGPWKNETKVMVLQQRFVEYDPGLNMIGEEWRDVPCVESK